MLPFNERILTWEKEFGPLVYTNRPVIFTRGKGVKLYTSTGEEYLDFVAAHGAANLGHAHPVFTKKLKEKLENYLVLHASYPNEERAKLYKTLAEITPSPLRRTFLSNSGSEAVEAAIKLAIVKHRNVKNPHIIAMKRSFHGRTLGSLALTFGTPYRKAFLDWISPHVSFVQFGDIDALKKEIRENTIAVIIEAIQGEGGIYPAPKEFPKQVKELCEEKGLTFIIDEIQSGIGRTGKLFAFQHYNVVPDIICLAKSLGGGIPIGATISSEEYFEAFNKGEIASTFGGNPFSCAAANITLDILKEENLIQNAENMGRVIEKRTGEWLEEEQLRSKIKETRGLGLMRGIQVKGKAGKYLKAAFEKKLLLLNAGMTVIRMLPPIIVSEDEINTALDILYTILKEN